MQLGRSFNHSGAHYYKYSAIASGWAVYLSNHNPYTMNTWINNQLKKLSNEQLEASPETSVSSRKTFLQNVSSRKVVLDEQFLENALCVIC
jgi:hypothetical protein